MIRFTIQIQDPDFDQDPGSGLRSRFYPDRTNFHAIFIRGVSPREDQSIKFEDDPDYDPDLGQQPSKKQKSFRIKVFNIKQQSALQQQFCLLNKKTIC